MITATPSLMYGVNLPSKNVVIRDYNRWTDQGQTNIPVFDYEQMSGRAGRPGFDTEGYSYLLAKTYDEAFNLATVYLNEMKVLNKTYNNVINEITQVAVDNVKVNDKCKFISYIKF